MVRVLKIERRVENGSTDPFHGLIDKAGVPTWAVIKTKNNAQGVLALINEFICYHLANEVGLTMPQSGAAFIGEECDTNGLITEEDKGHCFYSEYIKSTLLNTAVASKVNNKESFQEIIIFDHVTYNSDRNLGNLLLTSTKGDKILYAIDHTHVFKNQTIWDSQCLLTGIRENDYLDTRIMSENLPLYSMFFSSTNIRLEDFKAVAGKYRKIVSKELLIRIYSSIPQDWHIENKDLEALTDYILYRVSNLERMIEMIIRYREKGE